MPSIKVLLKKHCPEGVEYKTLGEISTEIYRGNGVRKDQLGTGDVPYISYTEIYTSFDIWFDECISTVDEDLIKNKKTCKKGDLLLAGSSNVTENIGKACVYLGEKECIVGGDIFLIKHGQNSKYLSFALTTQKSIDQKQKYSTKGTITHLTTDGVKKIKIPLPPLEIQEKIADILDRFRELGKFLKKELEIRKKQYEFYRDKLIVGGGVDVLLLVMNEKLWGRL